MHTSYQLRRRKWLGAIALMAFAIFAPAGAGQEYREPASNRAVGVPIDRFIGSWRNSEPVANHGNLVERAILNAGDPYNPGPPGAVLEFHKKFSLATLPGGARTEASRHEEQEVLYIEQGEGRIESSEYYWPLRAGYGVLIPPQTEHVLVNESKEAMTMLVLTDLLEPEANRGKGILVRNSAELPYAEKSAHWSYFAKLLFGPKDGTHSRTKILIVDMFPMTIGAPHPHIPHWEEVWCKLPPGSSYAFLGSEVREQGPNEAFVVPPNGKTVHSVVDLSDRPMSWFYFSRYTVNVEYPDWVYNVPAVPPQKK